MNVAVTVKITAGSQAEREEWGRIDTEGREAVRQYFEAQVSAVLDRIETWLTERITAKLKDGTLDAHLQGEAAGA